LRLKFVVFLKLAGEVPDFMVENIFAAVELGGTKCTAGIGDGTTIFDEVTIPTRLPGETVKTLINFINQSRRTFGGIKGLGIASFGPIDLNLHSADFGCIQNSPKKHWEGFNLQQAFSVIDCPTAIDTDVNAACLAEAYIGAGRDSNTVVYTTIGTGIGVGIVADGVVFSGKTHPEIGHISVYQEAHCDPFEGLCPYHRNCLEGLASGPAISARWGESLSDLPVEHPAHILEAGYLAQLVKMLTLSFSPDKIILGGGVMMTPGLIDLVRLKTLETLNGYISHLLTLDEMLALIKAPELENKSGLLGAMIKIKNIVLEEDFNVSAKRQVDA
jgi:fructokinase